jgi:hypothetical protein
MPVRANVKLVQRMRRHATEALDRRFDNDLTRVAGALGMVVRDAAIAPRREDQRIGR